MVYYAGKLKERMEKIVTDMPHVTETIQTYHRLNAIKKQTQEKL